MLPYHPSLPPLKPVQAIDRLDPASFAFGECLRELRYMCGTRTILPTSYILSSPLQEIGSQFVASGDSSEGYGATLDGSRVCVKRVRVFSKGGPEGTIKVDH